MVVEKEKESSLLQSMHRPEMCRWYLVARETVLVFLINVTVLASPASVEVFGLLAYSGRRANTMIGQGVFAATDYFRAALSIALLF